jgi:hypothetical protein
VYKRYVEDDDSDSLKTRGEDIALHLRIAAAAISRVKDPAAREALREMLYVLRQSNDVLYDLSPTPVRRARASRLGNPSSS